MRIKLTQTRAIRGRASENQIMISLSKDDQIRISFPDQVIRKLHWLNGDYIIVEYDPDDGYAFAKRDNQSVEGTRLYVPKKMGRAYIRFSKVINVDPTPQFSRFKITEDEVEFEIQTSKPVEN